jgi:hypothetical protein
MCAGRPTACIHMLYGLNYRTVYTLQVSLEKEENVAINSDVT